MFPTTLFSHRTIAISVLTLLVKCKQSDAHLTLSLSETQVTRIQPMVDAPVQGIVAAAGAPIDPTGADAFLGLQNEGSVLTVSVGVGVGSGGGTYKLVVDSGVSARVNDRDEVPNCRPLTQRAACRRAQISGSLALVVKDVKSTVPSSVTLLTQPNPTERRPTAGHL